MKLIKTFALAIVMIVTAAIANAQCAPWSATTEDKTLGALVERWAQAEGRHAKWEASVDFPIVNVEELNRVMKMSGATSMPNAVEWLLKTLRTEAGPKDVGYFACFYDQASVAVVIRAQGQPDCTKQL